MSILKVIKKDTQDDRPTIAALDYGTFVTDVPNGQECIYIKVKKCDRGGGRETRGIKLSWSVGCCVLLNLTYGTLRQIPEDTEVTPLIPELTVSRVKASDLSSVFKF